MLFACACARIHTLFGTEYGPSREFQQNTSLLLSLSPLFLTLSLSTKCPGNCTSPMGSPSLSVCVTPCQIKFHVSLHSYGTTHIWPKRYTTATTSSSLSALFLHHLSPPNSHLNTPTWSLHPLRCECYAAIGMARPHIQIYTVRYTPRCLAKIWFCMSW